MTIEELQQYVTTLVKDGLLLFSPDGLDAVNLLYEHELIKCNKDDILTEQSIRYINLVCQHTTPLGAEHLLSTLDCFGLLKEDYEFTDSNLRAVAKTAYPEEIASVLDTIYSGNFDPKKAQNYFEQLQCLAAEEGKITEKNLVLLQVHVTERACEPTWSIGAFEDELAIALRSMNASRENLTALAYDRESAIQPLTRQEEQRLKKAIKYYEQYIEKKGGVNACYTSLLNALTERYHENPIYLSISKSTSDTPSLFSMFSPYSGRSTSELSFRLPLEWDDFNKLPLTKANRKRALTLYYNNTVHTAYRFFKDIEHPGPWLADKKYWEPLVQYKEILAMLWIAATDENMPATDDYTIEGRIEYFIWSFSQFRRDKNNEKRRERIREPGKYEYYDDQEPDKPGCLLGFLDRAYDSVKWHPLFGLTWGVVFNEVRRSMLEHFKKTVVTQFKDQSSLLELYNAWSKVIAAESDTHEQNQHELILAQLNAPEKLQKKWLDLLQNKYVDLVEDQALISKYWELMSFNRLFPTHAHRFGGELLESFLAEKIVGQAKTKAFHDESSLTSLSSSYIVTHF
jgi:hypothetical protein